MQTDNLGPTIEGAEHEHDATTLPYVRDRLNATAGQIGIGNFMRANDLKRITTLG